MGIIAILAQALHFSTHRFSELAKCLVCRARGKKRGHQWMLDDSHEASYDDISVFVIPLHNREEDWLSGWHTVFSYCGAIQHQPGNWGIFAAHMYALFQQNQFAVELETHSQHLAQDEQDKLLNNMQEKHSGQQITPLSHCWTKEKLQKGPHKPKDTSLRYTQIHISADPSPFLILNNKNQLRSSQSEELAFNQTWTKLNWMHKLKHLSYPFAVTWDMLKTWELLPRQHWAQPCLWHGNAGAVAQTSWDSCHL